MSPDALFKHAQSRYRKEHSQPSWDGMESVRLRNCRRHEDKGRNTETGKRYEQSRSFAGTSGAPYNLFAAGTACIFVAYMRYHPITRRTNATFERVGVAFD
jgi:hypothetical protein